jgi:putative flippase GtrA
VRAAGVLIAAATLYVANRYFGIPIILANTLGIGVGFVFIYMFETLFTWKTHRE